MQARSHLFVFAAFLATVCFGQAPRPEFSYTLHASRQHHGGFTLKPPQNVHYGELDLAPDNSLLELIPQTKDRWVLKRLSGWDTLSPREDSLWIDSGRTREEDVQFDADLWINPDSTYAISVIRSHISDTRFVDSQPLAVIVVVDLRTFKQITRIMTSNLMLGWSSWHFSPNGLILLQTQRSTERQSNGQSEPPGWNLDAFQLPGLEQLAECQYAEEPKAGSPAADSQCTTLLRIAHIPSMEFFNSAPPSLAAKTIEAGIGKIPNCILSYISEGERYALYDCSTDKRTIWDTIKPTSRGVMVFDVAGRQPVINMKLPSSPDIALGLATSQGRDYMLLLREAIKLEVYRLP